MLKKIIAAVAVAVLLTSCGKTVYVRDVSEEANEANGTDSSGVSGTTTATVEPLTAGKNILTEKELSKLSHDKQGYGQGIQTDEKNRTIGALDFNEKYGKLGAKAIDDGKKITLTFDQGYENGYTAKILDVLKEKKVKATFFLLQDYAEKNPELVKRMIDEGHTLGNHSVHHYSMPTLSESKCRSEIVDFHKYMKDKYNYTMKLFRPPMGEFSEFSLGVTQSCGYETVLWSFAYADWDVNKQPDEAKSLDKLVNAAHDGAIYLLHSVSKTNSDILGSMIDKIRAKGFEFN